MRVIIAGGREITDYNEVCRAIRDSEFPITQIVHGAARGVDLLGLRYAIEHGIPHVAYPADWDNLDAPGAVIRTNRFGKPYNVVAGHQRNALMAANADALIAIWDGESKGTANMIQLAKSQKPRRLRLYIHWV